MIIPMKAVGEGLGTQILVPGEGGKSLKQYGTQSPPSLIYMTFFSDAT